MLFYRISCVCVWVVTVDLIKISCVEIHSCWKYEQMLYIPCSQMGSIAYLQIHGCICNRRMKSTGKKRCLCKIKCSSRRNTQHDCVKRRTSQRNLRACVHTHWFEQQFKIIAWYNIFITHNHMARNAHTHTHKRPTTYKTSIIRAHTHSIPTG